MSTASPSRSATAPGAMAALLWLAAAALLAMAPWFTTAAILPQLRSAWGLAGSQGALLTMAVQLGFAAGAVVSALFNLADLVAPRWLFALGAAGAAAANAGLLACHHAAAALPLRFLTGACLALVYPPGLKLMATWFRAGRGAALGIMVGALTLGSALPQLVNAFGGAAWRETVAVTSALALAGGLVGAGLVREGPFRFAAARFNPREIAQVFRSRGVRLASLGYFGHMWELYAMWAWVGVFLLQACTRAHLARPARAASLAAFAVVGVGAAGCWCGGRLSDRWGRPRAAALAMAVSGACALAAGWCLAAPLPWLLALLLLWGFSVVADSAQFSVLVTECADPRYVGTALTCQLGLGFTLTLVTLWLIPFLRLHAGWGWAFAALAPGPALGIAAMSAMSAMSAAPPPPCAVLP